MRKDPATAAAAKTIPLTECSKATAPADLVGAGDVEAGVPVGFFEVVASGVVTGKIVAPVGAVTGADAAPVLEGGSSCEGSSRRPTPHGMAAPPTG